MIEKAKKYKIPIYKCPNNGCILFHFNSNDDKIICRCGNGNPNINEKMQKIEKLSRTHYVKYLEKI
jgi:hypothetical protein